MITPLPGATTLKPGSATFPFFGVQPVILDDKGNELQVRPQWWCAALQCVVVVLCVASQYARHLHLR
jgi:acyl-coenzyme A synthetase/AMP-(fatty) acid ligase